MFILGLGLFLPGILSAQEAHSRPLIVGCDANYPPYEYLDSQGRPAGFNVDLIREISRETGLAFEIRSGPFQEIRQAFEAGTIDILAGWGYTPERAKNFLFSVHLNQISWSLFVRTSGPVIRSEDELEGKTIIAQKGDVNYDYFVSRNRNVLGVARPEDAFRALLAGQGDCAVVNKGVGLYILHRDQIQGVRRLEINFHSLRYCIALHKGNEELLGRINEAIFVLKESGRFQEIYDRHFGLLERKETTLYDVLKSALIVLVPIGALFLAILAWTFSLRSQVRRQTQSLAASEKRFRSLFEDSPAAIWEEDFSAIHAHFTALRQRGVSDFRQYWQEHPEEIPVLAGKVKVITLNKASIQILGGNRKEDILPNLPQYFTPQTMEVFKEELIALASGETIFRSEVPLKNLRGEQINVELVLMVHPDFDSDLSKVLVSFIDITERKLAESALREAQKMESIGTLAGGIAHDFNNLLTVIHGHSSLALHTLSKDSEAARHIEKAITATRRGADLTRQLLAYAGKGRFVIETIDLNRLVEENTQILRTVVPRNASLNFEFGKPSPFLKGDIGQIQQIIMNLIINAGEAIGSQTGSVTVRTGVVDLARDDTKYQKYSRTPLPPGKYALLQVADTGKGIRAQDLDQIFDPFFTTKFTGRGLGLAAILGIVRGHQGGIFLQSSEGRGTLFELVFPLAEPAAEDEPKRPLQPDCNGRGKTILVIDDEAPVIEVLSQILAGSNFTVLSSQSPLEGIELFRRHHREISLVLLDYSMPEMDGKAAFDALTAIDTTVRVIICSGYSEESLSSSFVGPRPAAFFQKPYDLSGLVQKISALAVSGSDAGNDTAFRP
ncbi:MAG TPA: transporter substrate-binding domain-containing protein [Candidatus Ozemobacteraceae bacterium]|nr:transporter substrate-binding domain-containing protein [Candidatus Ozemobacteraceae bacterium]